MAFTLSSGELRFHYGTTHYSERGGDGPKTTKHKQTPSAAPEASLLGTLAYHVKVPFSLLQALSAQRRRMAARILIPLSGAAATDNMVETNELIIQVHRCNGLDRLKGTVNTVQ